MQEIKQQGHGEYLYASGREQCDSWIKKKCYEANRFSFRLTASKNAGIIF